MASPSSRSWSASASTAWSFSPRPAKRMPSATPTPPSTPRSPARRRTTSARRPARRRRPAHGWSAATCAPPCATWSRVPTPRPRAMSPGACSCSGGSAATSWRWPRGWRRCSTAPAAPHHRASTRSSPSTPGGATRGRRTGPGSPSTLLDAATEFEVEGDLLGVAMATTTAGVAEINSATPDVAAATGWLRRGRGGVPGGARRVGRVPRVRRARTDRPARRQVRRRDRAVPPRRRGIAGQRRAIRRHRRASPSRAHEPARRTDSTRPRTPTSRASSGSVALRHEEGIAYCLEGLSAVAARRRDARRAGVLAGAAASIRRRTAAIDAPAFVYHVRFLDELRATDAADDLAAGEAEGLEFGAFEAAQFAAERRRPAGWSRHEVRRMSRMSTGGTPRDPHPRPAAARVRELDPARARRRSARRAKPRSSGSASPR